jgi:hypothetical protein
MLNKSLPKIFKMRIPNLLTHNVLHIVAVAASKHFPAGGKLAFRTAFSSGCSAAIEPICSLAAVAAIRFSVKFN